MQQYPTDQPPQTQYQSQQFQPPVSTPAASPYPYQQPMPPQMMSTVNVNVQQQKRGPSFLTRTLYFVFVGWWLGFCWLNLGYILCLFVVTIPLGLAMLNRLPQVITLRASAAGGAQTNVQVATMAMAPGQFAQTVNVNVSTGGHQRSFLARAIYFVCVGWWAGFIWAYMGYGLCVLIVTLPAGLMMLNRLPAVLTLRK